MAGPNCNISACSPSCCNKISLEELFVLLHPESRNDVMADWASTILQLAQDLQQDTHQRKGRNERGEFKSGSLRFSTQLLQL